ncbi:MAG: hypothetical protein J6L59_03590 [Clostridia bacterium]|nr:hypothetical protein [Clostridia bacterium]
MADHMIKMSEVPKGQRYQQFKDYYRIPLICALVGVIMVISILKSTVFAPKPDAYLLVATKNDVSAEFTASVETLYTENGNDFNGDEKNLISITPVSYNPLQAKTDPEVGMAMQTKLMAVLSTAENIMQIVDDDMFEYFSEQGLIGTYSDLGKSETEFGKAPSEIIKIPLSEIGFFKGEEFIGKTDGLYMTIRPRDGSQLGENKKKIARYEEQIEAFLTICK